MHASPTPNTWGIHNEIRAELYTKIGGISPIVHWGTYITSMVIISPRICRLEYVASNIPPRLARPPRTPPPGPNLIHVCAGTKPIPVVGTGEIANIIGTHDKHCKLAQREVPADVAVDGPHARCVGGDTQDGPGAGAHAKRVAPEGVGRVARNVLGLLVCNVARSAGDNVERAAVDVEGVAQGCRVELVDLGVSVCFGGNGVGRKRGRLKNSPRRRRHLRTGT